MTSKRTFLWPDGQMSYRVWNSGYPGGPPSTTRYYNGIADQELLISQGNPWPPKKGDKRGLGGDFLVIRREYSATDSPDMTFLGGASAAYVGKQYAYTGAPDNSHFPTLSPTSKASMEALGTTAIANVLPTNSVSSLSTFLGELREGIPKLAGSDFFKGRASRARSAGGEYLNVEFGWKPLISDLKKFAHAVKDSDALIKQYERNSGKLVRRRMDWPAEKSTSITTSNDGATPSITLATSSGVSAYNAGSKRTISRTSKRERWFEGVFTYYLPPQKRGQTNIQRNEQLLNYLYGTRVTPEVLWDLSPWTWAADWFANTGDVLHNIGAFAADGLVMPWAYIMERTTAITDVVTVQPFRQGYGTKTLRQTFTTTAKARYKASPYGFGITDSSLNPRQWAIMAALGISRSGSHY